MDNYKKSILVALAIGDGAIQKRVDKKYGTISYCISIKHCARQKEYLEYKARIINSILGGKNTPVVDVNNSGYPGCRYNKGNKKLKYIYNILYKDGKKYISKNVLNLLTPEGIAIWYMDDGSLYAQKRNGKIHAYQMVISTYCDTKEEVEEIISYFDTKYNIKFHIKKNKKKYSLTCNTKEIRKFIKIVEPYVSKVNCMKYKIDKIDKN